MEESNSPPSTSKADESFHSENLKTKLNNLATSNKNNESSSSDSPKNKQNELSQNPSTSNGTKSNLTKSSHSKDSSSGNGSGGYFRGRGPWTEAEDNELIAFVKKHGPGNWKNVSSLTNLNRDAQSCRLRWSSALDPNVDKSPFTEEEDSNLMRLVKWEGDTKWVNIASEFFPNRTGYQLQSRWHVLMNKLRKTNLEPEQQQQQQQQLHPQDQLQQLYLQEQQQQQNYLQNHLQNQQNHLHHQQNQMHPQDQLHPRQDQHQQYQQHLLSLTPFPDDSPPTISLPSRSALSFQKGSNGFSPHTPTSILAISSSLFPSSTSSSPSNHVLTRFSPTSASTASIGSYSPLKSSFCSSSTPTSSSRELSFPSLKTLSSPLGNVNANSSFCHEWPPNPKLMKYSAQEFQRVGMGLREEGEKEGALNVAIEKEIASEGKKEDKGYRVEYAEKGERNASMAIISKARMMQVEDPSGEKKRQGEGDGFRTAMNETQSVFSSIKENAKYGASCMERGEKKRSLEDIYNQETPMKSNPDVNNDNNDSNGNSNIAHSIVAEELLKKEGSGEEKNRKADGNGNGSQSEPNLNVMGKERNDYGIQKDEYRKQEDVNESLNRKDNHNSVSPSLDDFNIRKSSPLPLPSPSPSPLTSSLPSSLPSPVMTPSPSLPPPSRFSLDNLSSATAMAKTLLKKEDKDAHLMKQETKASMERNRSGNNQGKSKKGYGSRRGWLVHENVDVSNPKLTAEATVERIKSFRFSESMPSPLQKDTEKDKKGFENADLDLELNLGRKDSGMGKQTAGLKRDREYIQSLPVSELAKRQNFENLSSELSGNGLTDPNKTTLASFDSNTVVSEEARRKQVCSEPNKEGEGKDEATLAFDEFMEVVSDNPALKIALDEDLKKIKSPHFPESQKPMILKKIFFQISHLRQSRSTANAPPSAPSREARRESMEKEKDKDKEMEKQNQSTVSSSPAPNLNTFLIEEQKGKLLPSSPSSPPLSTLSLPIPSEKNVANTASAQIQTNTKGSVENSQLFNEPVDSVTVPQVEKTLQKYAEERKKINEVLQNDLLRCGLFSLREPFPSPFSPPLPVDKKGSEGGRYGGSFESRDSIRPQQSLVSIAAKILTGGESKEISEAELAVNQIIVKIAAKYELGKKLFEMTSQSRRLGTE